MSDPESDFKNLDHIDMTVRDLLTEMKDMSEVILDLAYASLMYNSESMAEKVYQLEEEMNDLRFAIRYKVLLASRTKEDARQLSGLLQVASAADIISDAAADMMALLNVPLEKRPFVSAMLSESDEKIRATKILSESGMVGYTIGELGVEANTGCKIIAVKSRQGWQYNPEDTMKLRSGDDIIVRGTEDGFNHLTDYAKGRIPWEFPEPDDDADDEDAAVEETVEEVEILEDDS